MASDVRPGDGRDQTDPRAVEAAIAGHAPPAAPGLPGESAPSQPSRAEVFRVSEVVSEGVPGAPLLPEDESPYAHSRACVIRDYDFRWTGLAAAPVELDGHGLHTIPPEQPGGYYGRFDRDTAMLIDRGGGITIQPGDRVIHDAGACRRGRDEAGPHARGFAPR